MAQVIAKLIVILPPIHILILTLLVGCGGVTAEPEASVDQALSKPLWCIVATVKGSETVACTTKKWVCEKTLRMGKGSAGVTSIKGCIYRP